MISNCKSEMRVYLNWSFLIYLYEIIMIFTHCIYDMISVSKFCFNKTIFISIIINGIVLRVSLSIKLIYETLVHERSPAKIHLQYLDFGFSRSFLMFAECSSWNRIYDRFLIVNVCFVCVRSQWLKCLLILMFLLNSKILGERLLNKSKIVSFFLCRTDLVWFDCWVCWDFQFKCIFFIILN